MSQTRITSLAVAPPQDGQAEPHGDVVASVLSFRSNISSGHFVVSLNDGHPSDDESPMGYVDLRSAVDLASHFVAIAQQLGAKVTLVSDQELHGRVSKAFEAGQLAGHWDGRRSLRDELQAHLNTV